ncbi:hypothetical protein [Roseovarius litoreus]|uniref:hypothetical protein n=1 Tax=Roseovarius litoreus TaxID=1155722 RepID=UPI00122D1189|nr:hypothetical protein [Roseovarius litoreus]
MDKKQEFNIASKQPDDQKRSLDDRKRLLEIEKIRDPAERQHHHEAMMLRDEKLKIEEQRAKREEKNIVEKEVQKQMLAKEQLQLTMKKSEGLPREQREKMVRQMVSHNVRISHGAELDQHQKQIRQDMNAEIDRGIKESLLKQERSRHEPEQKPAQQRSLSERRQEVGSKKERGPEGLGRSWREASRDRGDEGRKP